MAMNQIQLLEIQAYSECEPFEHNFHATLTSTSALPQPLHDQVCMILFMRMGGPIIRTGKGV